MIAEAALITLSCVLFVQMGLSEAIADVLGVRFRILSCPKCLSFWAVLLWTALNGFGLVRSVATSFISSYCVMWLALVYDALAVMYNYCYEQITKTTDTAESASADPDPAAGSNAVS